MVEYFETDDKKLTILDVKFSTVKIYRAAKSAIGSNIVEGYKPTHESVERIKKRFDKEGWKMQEYNYEYIDEDGKYTNKKTGV